MKAKHTWIAAVVLAVAGSSCASTTDIAAPVAVNRTEIYFDRWTPDHVWAPAHYEYKNSKRVKVRGRYQKVARYRTTYAPAHIRRTERGKLWIDERWK